MQQDYDKMVLERDEKLDELKKDLAEFKQRCSEQEVKIILQDKQQ